MLHINLMNKLMKCLELLIEKTSELEVMQNALRRKAMSVPNGWVVVVKVIASD